MAWSTVAGEAHLRLVSLTLRLATPRDGAIVWQRATTRESKVSSKDASAPLGVHHEAGVQHEACAA